MAKKEKIISPLDIHGLTFYHLPRWLSGKGVGKAGDTDLIFGWGRSPGGGNGNPLQHPCLGNPMDRGAWGSHTQLSDLKKIVIGVEEPKK